MSQAFTTGGCPSRGLKAHVGLGKTPQSHVLSARHTQATRQGRSHCRIEARAAPVGMGVWATKAGMTSIFTPEGLCLPATVLALEEGNIVTQVPSSGSLQHPHSTAWCLNPSAILRRLLGFHLLRTSQPLSEKHGG